MEEIPLFYQKKSENLLSSALDKCIDWAKLLIFDQNCCQESVTFFFPFYRTSDLVLMLIDTMACSVYFLFGLGVPKLMLLEWSFLVTLIWVLFLFLKYCCFQHSMGWSILELIFFMYLRIITLLPMNIRSDFKISAITSLDSTYYLHICFAKSDSLWYKKFMLSKLALIPLYCLNTLISFSFNYFAMMHLLKNFFINVFTWIFNYLV